MNKEITDLTKAIDLGTQAAEGLKKSQIPLFGGDPHHKAYTRTSASGKVSNIAAKGTPRQNLPSDVYDANVHASKTSHDAWRQDKENAYSNEKNPGAVKEAHDNAAEALRHSANLHAQAAQEAETRGSHHVAKNHKTSAEFHRQLAAEHGERSEAIAKHLHQTESHRLTADASKASIKAFESDELGDHRDAATAHHEAAATYPPGSTDKMYHEEKAQTHSHHVERLEREYDEAANLSNSELQNQHKIGPDRGKGDSPDAHKATAKLRNVSNKYSDHLARKPANMEEAHTYSKPIPASAIKDTETRHYNHDDVFQTGSGGVNETAKSNNLLANFKPEFHAKNEGNPFILKHKNGKRYLVDPEGGNYARYIAPIKEGK